MKNSLKFLCIIKHGNEQAEATANDVAAFLAKHNIDVIMHTSHAGADTFAESASECQAGIVIGGDGTMLAVARALHAKSLPLVGINYGKVGFLTEIDPSDWENWIIRLIDYIQEEYFQIPQTGDKIYLEKHTLFVCEVHRNNELVHTCYALNDAVIARGKLVRTISLSLSINNQHLSSLRCDGLIVSTPLGATAYAISAHGPLAIPGLEAQIITPICPFAGAFPPIVVAGSSKLCVEITESNSPAILTMDGQESFELEFGDFVHITEHSEKMSLLVSDKSWYLKRLVDRGYIRQGPGAHNILDSKQ